MFKNDPQISSLPIFYSIGSDPLSAWEVKTKCGTVAFLEDPDTRSRVLDLSSPNVTETYMVCPKGGGWLGARLPFLVMVLKNMKRHFCAQATVRDSRGMNRRFRWANFQSRPSVNEFSAMAPINLDPGWNRLIINLDEYTTRIYGTRYVETGAVMINANVRVKNVYFARELLDEEQLPREYRFLSADVRRRQVVRNKIRLTRNNAKKTEELAPPNSPKSNVEVNL